MELWVVFHAAVREMDGTSSKIVVVASVVATTGGTMVWLSDFCSMDTSETGAEVVVQVTSLC